MELSVKIDTDKFVQSFNKIPLLAAKELRIELKNSCNLIQRYAKMNHRFKSKSNALENGINYDVDSSDLSAEIKLNHDGRSPYAIYQHEGTKAHSIAPKNKKALYFVNNGKKYFSKGHEVKGIKEDKFLYKAAEKQEPVIVTKITSAINKIIAMAGF